MTYWVSTKSSVNLNRRPQYRTAKFDKFLRENVGVDPTLLAQEMKISVSCVLAYQRHLGLRRLTTHSDYK
jgi:hypothetical protein